MTHRKSGFIVTSIAALLMFNSAYGWEHEVAVGYGGGQEVEEDYQNRAILLSGKLYKFPKIDDYLIATIDSSITHIHADTADHRNTTTLSMGLGLRAYFVNPDSHLTRPYLGISTGPSYLTSKQLGNRKQGASLDLRTTIEGGVEFGLAKNRSIDVNLQLIHYCNAGLAYPNQGFNVPLMLSVGYQF